MRLSWVFCILNDGFNRTFFLIKFELIIALFQEPSSVTVEIHLLDTNDNSPVFLPSKLYKISKGIYMAA